MCRSRVRLSSRSPPHTRPYNTSRYSAAPRRNAGPGGGERLRQEHTAPGSLRAAAPCWGQVLYNGRELGRFGRKEFARLVSILPQTRDVPAIRAGQLVAHGRYPHLSFGRDLTQADREKIAWAMEVTGTTALKDKELSQLSGGERQRVYLAMTLSQDTDILFLDEPTTYLDIGQKYEMLELIAQVNAMGKTVVMVLHDLPLAFSYSHQVVVLEKGRLAAQGPAAQVFASGVPARVFGVKSQALEVDGCQEYFFYQA